jgi:integrase
MAARIVNSLWQRGRQYHLKLHIPRPLRQHFLTSTGQPKREIVQPLGDSYSEARRLCDRLIVAYGDVFDRLKAGEVMTQAQIEAAIAEALTPPVLTVRALLNPTVSQMEEERARQDAWLRAHPSWLRAQQAADGPKGETISQAADAWFADMTRDPSAAPKAATLDGHKKRVAAFVAHAGDVPLASVSRATAAEFLTKVAGGGRSNRTTNAYATTMAGLFKSATHRGRFTGNNPFDGQKRKAGGDSYEAFQVSELQTLFDALPCEIAPAKHTPDTALPWVSMIAAYSGMRLEEIAQLKTSDIRDQGANGSTVTVIDIHNGGSNTLKNESSARLVPVHSQLVRAGLLDYAKALPKDGLLFPGLKRRESKGGKIGARVGELFRKQLEALGLKRDRLCFHSFRHTVAEALEAAAVSQTDAARVLGHTISGMSYGVYSSGPGLKRLAAVVEEIAYPGLTIKPV